MTIGISLFNVFQCVDSDGYVFYFSFRSHYFGTNILVGRTSNGDVALSIYDHVYIIVHYNVYLKYQSYVSKRLMNVLILWFVLYYYNIMNAISNYFVYCLQRCIYR